MPRPFFDTAALRGRAGIRRAWQLGSVLISESALVLLALDMPVAG